jgi:hypothetical protein
MENFSYYGSHGAKNVCGLATQAESEDFLHRWVFIRGSLYNRFHLTKLLYARIVKMQVH